MVEGQNVELAAALGEAGTSPSANLGGLATPWLSLDGNLLSTEVGSGDEGLAAVAAANEYQPWVGWRGSGDKVGFEVQAAGGGEQREGG